MFRIYAKHDDLMPEQKDPGASGYDLKANITSVKALNPGQRAIIPTGLFVELPLGYEMQIRPRSGLAAKHGVTVLNTPGTIDSSYRGEIGVIMVNLDREKVFEINPLDRIAQGVIAQVSSVDWVRVSSVEELAPSDRGVGGFGSTGMGKAA